MARHIPLATAAEPGLPILLPIHSLRLVISSSESQPITRPRPRRGATAAALGRFAPAWTDHGRRRAMDRDFSGCRRYGETTLLCHHSALLGDPTDADDIVRALDKIRGARAEL